jgi:hypothetical protein
VWQFWPIAPAGEAEGGLRLDRDLVSKAVKSFLTNLPARRDFFGAFRTPPNWQGPLASRLRGHAHDGLKCEVNGLELAENPRFKKIYDSMVAFRSDSYLWWSVAEMSFDSFQERMRART